MSTKTQEIYLQATSKIKQTTMASRRSPYMYSPTIGSMPQTYRKLTSAWDAKTGSRDYTANVFCNTDKKDAVLHVPSILLALFNELHENSDMIKELKSVNSGAILGDDGLTIWLYTMRSSDAMPKNAEELERLYAFVRIFSEKHLDTVSYAYITENIHIAVSFFVWFFTKKNFYYYTKEIRQTTRGGIQKQWRSILLMRVPAVVIQNLAAPKARGDIHQKTILTKLEEAQSKLKSDITKFVTSDCLIDFDDISKLHKTISQCTTSGNKSFVSNKQGKKLQKTYDEYVKVTDKVNKTRKSLFHIETADKKKPLMIVLPHQSSEDWGGLGEPPSPPKLIRQCADNIGNTTPEQDEIRDIPESWEDL